MRSEQNKHAIRAIQVDQHYTPTRNTTWFWSLGLIVRASEFLGIF